MQMTQKLFSTLGLALVIAASVNLGVAEAGQKALTEQSAHKGATPAKREKWDPTPAALEDLYHRVWQAIGDSFYAPEQLTSWGEWEHKYDGKLTRGKELDKAIHELLASVGDRWPRYTSKDDSTGARFHQYLERSVHIGMLLARNEDGTYRIEALVYGSPAQKSVLRVGDTIKYIDQHDLKRSTPAQVEALLHQPVGSTIRIVYSADGEDSMFEMEVSPTPPAPVVAKLLNRSILYARLPDFRTDEILATFENCILEIQRKAPSGIDGVVFDLRGNPGGEFKRGVSVASYFLEKGVVATSTTRDGRLVVEAAYRTTPIPSYAKQSLSAEWKSLLEVLHERPLVVLVDGSSMSASELVAGALKDNGRALIVGTPTFGKAVGYQRYDLDNEGELTITSMKYRTPKGTDVSRGGLQPDVLVQQTRGSQDVQLSAAVEQVNKLIQAGKQATSPGSN